jgi:hypothetical protein
VTGDSFPEIKDHEIPMTWGGSFVRACYEERNPSELPETGHCHCNDARGRHFLGSSFDTSSGETNPSALQVILCRRCNEPRCGRVFLFPE